MPAPAASAQNEDEEARSSPLVRKIAREHGISLSQLSGTGLGGRITKQDIMQFIDTQAGAPAAGSATASVGTPHVGTAHVGTDAFVRPAERSEASAPAPTPRP